MGEISPIHRALLGRSMAMLKRSKILATYGFPNEISAAAPIRRYASTIESAHGLYFRNPNFRAYLSHGLPLPYNKTTTRYMTSVADKIENLVQNNKVR